MKTEKNRGQKAKNTIKTIKSLHKTALRYYIQHLRLGKTKRQTQVGGENGGARGNCSTAARWTRIRGMKNIYFPTLLISPLDKFSTQSDRKVTEKIR